tara:strand:- start:3065 stop:5005 length:1941 start_codon:yes stop_codon:yes gene_type:complete
MKVQWRRQSLFPSTQKPGVFPFSSSVDDLGDETNVELWNKLVGTDGEELNTFKFSLGTWTVFRRLNRKIQILSHEQTNNLANRVVSDAEEEPKPGDEPDGFGIIDGYDGIYSWAIENENILPGNTPNGLSTSEFGEFLIDDGRGSIDPDNDDDSLKKRDYDVPGGHGIRYENEDIGNRPRAYTQYKNGNANRESYDRYWEAYDSRVDTKGINQYYLYFRPNLAGNWGQEVNKRGVLSPNRQWKWEPSNSRIIDYENGLSSFGQWIPSNEEAFIQFQTQEQADNVYVGIATSENEEIPSEIKTQDLPIYHEIGSDAYTKNSSPLKIYFSFNLSEIDNNNSDNKLRYYILEWGDEDIQLSSEDILNSEFFEIYETEDESYDKFTVKKLMQYISDSHVISGGEVMEEESERGKIHEHMYTEPGVKTIKTIVFRLDNTETYLYETSLVYTQIFITDPNEKIQNFNIFGASDSTILPVEDKNEFIIGSIDNRSQYVRSLDVIESNDLYESSDYLEKLYANEFLPAVNDSLYGDYAGNLDLGQSRVFNKPYDIYDFITDDKQSVVDNQFEITQDSLPQDSSATEILIGNNDCIIELTPSNLNNFDIENTALSSEKGILIGDYSLIKEKGEGIRREDTMELPRLEQRQDKQAF